MDKKTILAIVLTVVIVVAISAVQIIGQQKNAPEADKTATVLEETAAEGAPASQASADYKANTVLKPVGESGSAASFVYENDLYRITFNPAGGVAESMKLKKYSEDGQPLEIIFRTPLDPGMFMLYEGENLSKPIDAVFDWKIEGQNIIFSRDFILAGGGSPDGEKFTIRKTIRVGEGDYMVAIKVDIVSESGKAALDFNGFSYTIGFEPEIGPSFTEMKNNNYNYRRFFVAKYDNGKKAQVKFNNGIFDYNEPVKWIQLTGKYFTSIAIPKNPTDFDVYALQKKAGNLPQSDSYYFNRRAGGSSSVSDVFNVYIGPQLKQYLQVFDYADRNSFGLKDMKLTLALDGGGLFGWLENALKWCLTMINKFCHNWGVAIIILTVLIKLAILPLSKKSTQSSAKMAELQPQMKEIQEKYKDNPEAQNREVMKLYKENNVSPMSGCLPLLIQMPILIAFYGLLNKHFELRGAMFIPGWIPDLSQPDTIATLPFSLPLLGNQIHLLPILYTVSMIYSMKLTQQTNTSANSSMNTFMTWVMPIMFFFILYSAPSGLLLYWSVMNAITIGQQLIANSKLRKKNAEIEAEAVVVEATPRTLPPKAKKKGK